MTKLAASGFATAFALAMLASSAIALRQEQAVAAAQDEAVQTAPTERMGLGQCRIHYWQLPEAKQPAAMECEHAHWVAQRWGGQVLERTGAGTIEAGSYEGRNDFTGVPSEALPRRGYCRAWIDGADVSEQPAESDCRVANIVANARGGRVLFMPL